MRGTGCVGAAAVRFVGGFHRLCLGMHVCACASAAMSGGLLRCMFAATKPLCIMQHACCLIALKHRELSGARGQYEDLRCMFGLHCCMH